MTEEQFGPIEQWVEAGNSIQDHRTKAMIYAAVAFAAFLFGVSMVFILLHERRLKRLEDGSKT